MKHFSVALRFSHPTNVLAPTPKTGSLLEVGVPTHDNTLAINAWTTQQPTCRKRILTKEQTFVGLLGSPTMVPGTTAILPLPRTDGPSWLTKRNDAAKGTNRKSPSPPVHDSTKTTSLSLYVLPHVDTQHLDSRIFINPMPDFSHPQVGQNMHHGDTEHMETMLSPCITTYGCTKLSFPSSQNMRTETHFTAKTAPFN